MTRRSLCVIAAGTCLLLVPSLAAVAQSKSKTKKSYTRDELEYLPPKFFGENRDWFQEVAPRGWLLVGVKVSYIERFGGHKISSVQPLFRSVRTVKAGARFGTVMGKEITVTAKPGYAVGALITNTGLTVDGFGMTFMKVVDDRLDREQSYDSPWLGDRQGGSPKDVVSDGRLCVGLQGRSRKEVNALGLVVAK